MSNSPIIGPGEQQPTKERVVELAMTVDWATDIAAAGLTIKSLEDLIVIYNGEINYRCINVSKDGIAPLTEADFIALVGGSGGGIGEAPEDGTQYARQNALWSRVPAIIPEAPNDGKTYGRNSAAWAEVAGIEIISFISDATSDLELTVSAAWNDYADRNVVTRASNQIFYFKWPSTSQDVFQYIGSQLASPWTSTDLEWVSLGGGAVSWGAITGSIDAQTDLANALDAKGGVGIDLTFDADTTQGDPLNGGMRFNNADQSLATAMYVSAFSTLGNSLVRYWNGHQTNDLFNIVENVGLREFITVNLTGEPINNTTWFEIPIEVLDFRGPMTDAGPCSVYYTNDSRTTVRVGGTIGQVYSKLDDNLNYAWVDPDTGPQGPIGETGADGAAGAAATADAGTTTTLAPAAPATVVNSGTTAAAIFDFGIPQGVAGAAGADGLDSVVPGPIGETGPAGADSVVPGPAGDPGLDGADGADGGVGPEGPSAVSEDPDNSAVLGSDSLIFVPAAAGGGATEFEVAQVAHGFVLLDIVRYNGTAWVKALADDGATLGVAVVVAVAGVDAFTAAISGRYTAPAHGLTVASFYYLSDTVAGGNVDVAPAIEQPILFAEDADWFIVMPYRPSLGGEGEPGIPEAPIDATPYVRQDAAWLSMPPSGIEEAPADATPYVRQDTAWLPMPPSGLTGIGADAIHALTQAEYDLLAPPLATTLYFITG
jgi:hypothetical protein